MEEEIKNDRKILNKLKHIIEEGEVLKKKVRLYEQTMKQVIDRQYEKEMIFYDDIGIYSRHDLKHISPEELCEFILEITKDSD